MEIYGEVTGSEGSNIVFRVNSNVWMISLIGKKWRNTSSSTQSIIIGKLHKRQKFRPVILLVITIYTEVLLKSLVCVFGLSITFGMVV